MSRTFRPKQICLNEDDDFEGHGAAILFCAKRCSAKLGKVMSLFQI